jgi:hypothetical protein
MAALLLSRVLCPVGTVSLCVSWPCRIPTGSGKAGLMKPEAGGPELTGGVGAGRGRVPAIIWILEGGEVEGERLAL